MESAEIDQERQARWRRHLAQKGTEIYAVLTAILAGKQVTLATLKLPHEQRPGEKPEEKLRRYLDQVSRAQKRLGTQSWGLCVTCGQTLDPLLLDEAAWTELCATCQKQAMMGQ